MTAGIVPDASALVSLVTNDDRGAAVESALRNRPLHAPSLVHFEVLHALRGLELGGKLTSGQAVVALADLLLLPLELTGAGPLADRIWQLRPNLTANDAAYVALAERLELPLLTLDEKLARAPGLRCEVVVPA